MSTLETLKEEVVASWKALGAARRRAAMGYSDEAAQRLSLALSDFHHVAGIYHREAALRLETMKQLQGQA